MSYPSFVRERGQGGLASTFAIESFLRIIFRFGLLDGRASGDVVGHDLIWNSGTIQKTNTVFVRFIFVFDHLVQNVSKLLSHSFHLTALKLVHLHGRNPD